MDRAEQLSAVTELLKAYQNEIDLLTKRAKSGEAAFVGLYKSVYEVPDPVSTLQGLVSQIRSGAGGGLEIARLQGELAQYEEEFRQLKNQDIRIRQLEEQLRRYEESADDRVAEALAARVEAVERSGEERALEQQELVRAAEKRALEAAESSRVAQLALERMQTQLLHLSSSADRRQADLLAENSLLAERCERVSSHATELEGRLVALASSGSGSSRGEDTYVSGGREERALRDAVADLQVQLHLRDEALRVERGRAEGADREQAVLVAALRRELDVTVAELHTRPSREELLSTRQQLRSLQRLVYGVQDGEEGTEASTSPLTESSADASVEEVLARRVRAQETQLLELRRALRGAQEREAEVERTAAALKEALDSRALLIAGLEKDLETRTSTPSGKGKAPMSELALLIDGTGEEAREGGHSMTSILQGQRDRYKERLAQVRGCAADVCIG